MASSRSVRNIAQLELLLFFRRSVLILYHKSMLRVFCFIHIVGSISLKSKPSSISSKFRALIVKFIKLRIGPQGHHIILSAHCAAKLITLNFLFVQFCLNEDTKLNLYNLRKYDFFGRKFIEAPCASPAHYCFIQIAFQMKNLRKLLFLLYGELSPQHFGICW